MLLGCPRQKINHSSEKLKVICIKRFLFYVRINYVINYQCKTSEHKNLEELVEEIVQALKTC